MKSLNSSYDIEDLESVNDLDDDQKEKVKLRAKTVRKLIGFHWSDIKTDFLGVAKRRCDRWESLRKEHGINRGGCKFCPLWDGENNQCILKDKYIPLYNKEVKE